MPGKRVLMLLSNPFRPDPRVHKEALALVGAGYRVTIVCWDREGKHPARETVDGIDIRRVGPISSFSSTITFMRTLPAFWRQARNAIREEIYDIIHAHDLDTLSPAVREAKRRKIPLVYDSHELYHEMAAERLPRALARMVAAYERRMVRKPDHVICVNERFQEIIRSWGARKVTVVMGCPPEPGVPREDVERVRAALSPGGMSVVLYIGVLEPHRCLLELASGFSAGKCPMAMLVMGGYGTLKDSIASMVGPRLKFLGPVKPDMLPAYTLASDILVAVYDPRFGNNRDSVPNKLFEAMAAGRPIIVAKDTYTGQVVERTGCGLTVEYGTDQVFEAIERLLSDRELYDKCARNGRAAFEREYNWPNMEKRLLKVYDELLA